MALAAKGKNPQDWQLAEKTRALHRKLDAPELTVLLFEAILLSSVGLANPDKSDDSLTAAAAVYKINFKMLRSAVAREAQSKARQKAKPTKSAATKRRKY